jgi:hypothetical protein
MHSVKKKDTFHPCYTLVFIAYSEARGTGSNRARSFGASEEDADSEAASAQEQEQEQEQETSKQLLQLLLQV